MKKDSMAVRAAILMVACALFVHAIMMMSRPAKKGMTKASSSFLKVIRIVNFQDILNWLDCAMPLTEAIRHGLGQSAVATSCKVGL